MRGHMANLSLYTISNAEVVSAQTPPEPGRFRPERPLWKNREAVRKAMLRPLWVNRTRVCTSWAIYIATSVSEGPEGLYVSLGTRVLVRNAKTACIVSC
ncbi:hypothetical protein ASPWEDRAFT_238027 [Aspergillus wentii DTO 134E9]|uniref:Uncharacterized protein n=1 Tax=Aspergillus wentii DTO 134E9 TaxID=1073089 RepID=A0A1L9S1D2_ASPWE|nr:uncharacterized protein ASPWEDRAFT_238027 [Aspergillus wentii DTO 134E9]OJJ40944.1 hypothetical protein ASPWEDRAFT_238027 [Aspergillus wentii DTO 134E9]